MSEPVHEWPYATGCFIEPTSWAPVRHIERLMLDGDHVSILDGEPSLHVWRFDPDGPDALVQRAQEQIARIGRAG